MGRQKRISPNFPWPARRLRAVVLVAEDEVNDEEIARRVGCTDRQLTNWKRDPEFRRRVADYQAGVRAALIERGIAEKQYRVDSLVDTHHRLEQLLLARGSDPTVQHIPGAFTGLLVRTVKVIGQGDAAREVEESEIDTGLLRELREHKVHVAKELGEWQQDGGGTASGTRVDVRVILADLRQLESAGEISPPFIDDDRDALPSPYRARMNGHADRPGGD